MLDREYIINGQLVSQNDGGVITYHFIQDVGNAIEKGDRDDWSPYKNELSFSIVNILTGDVNSGICEDSGMTSSYLSPATFRDVQLYLRQLRSKQRVKMTKAMMKISKIDMAMNEIKNTYENG